MKKTSKKELIKNKKKFKEEFKLPLAAVLGGMLLITHLLLVVLFYPVLIIISWEVHLISIAGIVAAMLIGGGYSGVTKRLMPNDLKINSSFFYFIVHGIFLTISIISVESPIKKFFTALVGFAFLAFYCVLIYFSLGIGSRNYFDFKIYKIPKNFFKGIFIYGILFWIFYKLFYHIDAALFYNPRLKTTANIKKRLISSEKKKNKYAFLVSGSGLIGSYLLEDRKLLQAAYNALKQRGYTDAEIIILSNTVPNSRTLDTGITARPKLKNFHIIMQYILKNIKPNGSLVFYYTGHGKRKKNKSTFLLGNDQLNEEEFYPYFEHLKKLKKVFIFNQCYSGGFFEKMKALKNICILASTEKTKQASNIPEIEILFWKKIAKGEEVLKAYKKAVIQMGLGHKLARNVLRIVTFGGVRNYYLVYKKGQVNIPKS
jgi:hypothetical protein